MNAVSRVTNLARPLRIGELAERTGLTVHTIRWYEAQGLIPGVIRDAGGRRSYIERHLGWIELIDKLRLTGMSIAQIRDYALLVAQGRSTIKQQHDMLCTHRTRVYATIDEWHTALKMLDHKIEYFDEWLSTGRRPDKPPGKPPGQPRGQPPGKALLKQASGKGRSRLKLAATKR